MPETMTISWTKPLVSTLSRPKPAGCYYDEEKADRAVRFFGMLNLVEGKGAGEPWQLLPWQEHELIRPLFGWHREDGTRLFRTVYCELPRKNGKTTLAAGVALYGLLADGEPGAQVILAARDRAQARLCYDLARKMVQQTPALSKRCRAVRSYIEHPKSGSVLRAISSEAGNQHGLNAHVAVIDEIHSFPNRELYDVVTTSVGARRQPIVFSITTAGQYDPFSISYELHDYTERVASGDVDDPSFLGVIYGSAKDADWKDPDIWHQANPSLGTTVTTEYLAQEVARASVSPARQNTFRQLHLGQWVNQQERWIDPEAWAACGDPLRERVQGRPAFLGLDLSSTTDISAAVVLRPDPDGTYDVEPFFWIPLDGLDERERRDRLPYRQWVTDGHVQATPGNLVDYAWIKARIFELADLYQGRLIVGYDPWNATGLITQLLEAGVQAVPVRQGYATMSSPTKELERLILAKGIRHAGHPVLASHVSSAQCISDPAGNSKVDKSRSTARIDGCVATIMALHLAMLAGSADSYTSVYESRGITTL